MVEVMTANDESMQLMQGVQLCRISNTGNMIQSVEKKIINSGGLFHYNAWISQVALRLHVEPETKQGQIELKS